MAINGFKASAAGDESYILTHSVLDLRNWYIKNVNDGQIVWNGAFDSAYEAIEAAEMDGFEFSGGLAS